jgi:hypothetical protein
MHILAHGGNAKCIKILVGKVKGKDHSEDIGIGWKDNIKINVRKIGFGKCALD